MSPSFIFKKGTRGDLKHVEPTTKINRHLTFNFLSKGIFPTNVFYRGEDSIVECVPIVVIAVVDLMSNFFDNIAPIVVTLIPIIE